MKEHASILASVVLCLESTYVSLSFLEARNLVRVQAPVPGDFDCRVWDSGKGMKLDVPPRFTFILPNCAENSVQTPCVFIDLFCTQTQ